MRWIEIASLYELIEKSETELCIVYDDVDVPLLS